MVKIILVSIVKYIHLLLSYLLLSYKYMLIGIQNVVMNHEPQEGKVLLEYGSNDTLFKVILFYRQKYKNVYWKTF